MAVIRVSLLLVDTGERDGLKIKVFLFSALQQIRELV